MKKRFMLIIAVTVCLFTVISACNSPMLPPDVDLVRSDIVTKGGWIIPNNQTINSIEVIELIPNEEMRSVVLNISVVANDEIAEYLYYINIGYFAGEDDEWVFDSIDAMNRSDWKVTPIKGVDESELRSVVLWESFTVDDEYWNITEDNLGNISVDSRNTQLDLGKDTLTATVTVNDDVLVASGQMQFEYKFDNGWRLEDYKNITPFTTSEREDVKLTLEDGDVLAEVLAMRLPFIVGSSWSPETQQIIDVTEAEISGFALKHMINSKKGVFREYEHSFVLDKGFVVFDVAVTSKYSYEKMTGWTRDDFIVDMTVTSADIEGTKWVGEHILIPSSGTGTNPPPAPMVLEITDIASNGAAIAILTFDFGDDTTIVQEFEGMFHQDTLTLELNFKKWESTPLPRDLRRTGYPYPSNFERRFNGYVSVGDLSVKTSNHNNSWYHNFELFLVEGE